MKAETPFFFNLFVAMFKIKYEESWLLPFSDDVSETGDVSWHSDTMLTECRARYAMKIGTCLWVPVRLLAELHDRLYAWMSRGHLEILPLFMYSCQSHLAPFDGE